MTDATPTESVRQAWDGIAADYDRRITERNIEIADRALDHVDVRAGSRVLDVACGSGALAIAAARRGALVTATDISPEMVARTLSRARSEGLADLTAVVADGQAMDLDDDGFDVVGSQYGAMLFADFPAGLAEMTRVTRPGGQVVVVTMGALPPKLEFLGFFLAAIAAVAPDTPGPFSGGPPRELQLADRDVLGARMAEAGLADVRIGTIDATVEFRDGADYWDWITSSNPVGRALVAGLSTSQGEEVRRVLDGMLHERATEGDGLLHNPTHVAVGTA